MNWRVSIQNVCQWSKTWKGSKPASERKSNNTVGLQSPRFFRWYRSSVEAGWTWRWRCQIAKQLVGRSSSRWPASFVESNSKPIADRQSMSQSPPPSVIYRQIPSSTPIETWRRSSTPSMPSKSTHSSYMDYSISATLVSHQWSTTRGSSVNWQPTPKKQKPRS